MQWMIDSFEMCVDLEVWHHTFMRVMRQCWGEWCPMMLENLDHSKEVTPFKGIGGSHMEIARKL